MPGTPFATAVTVDELWKNILADLGQVVSPGPIEMIGILRLLDNALFGQGVGLYGDASDGLVVFDGTTTVLGLAPSSSVYTLTRDIWLGNSSAINTGVTIKTAGFRVFCEGNLINNGTIQSNGNAAAANVAGALLSYTGTLSATTVGTAGGAGSTGVANAGTNGAANGLGGVGGAGGANASVPNAGGLGGTVTAPAATVQLPRSATLAVMGRLQSTTAFVVAVGGSGGGSGGGDGTNLSGGGGGGGGIVVVAANTITGTGTISANGGAGGAAAAAGTPSGGGGGGGGLVIVVSASVAPPAVTAGAASIAGQTVTAAGGAPGAAGAGGGTVGLVGLAGTVILLPT